MNLLEYSVEDFMHGKEKITNDHGVALVRQMMQDGYEFYYKAGLETHWGPAPDDPNNKHGLGYAINHFDGRTAKGQKVYSFNLFVRKNRFIVGNVVFKGYPDIFGKEMASIHTIVGPKWQGKKIGPAMYNLAAKISGYKIVPSDVQLDAGKKFWTTLRFEDIKMQTLHDDIALFEKMRSEFDSIVEQQSKEDEEDDEQKPKKKKKYYSAFAPFYGKGGNPGVKSDWMSTPYGFQGGEQQGGYARGGGIGAAGAAMGMHASCELTGDCLLEDLKDMQVIAQFG